MKAGWLYYWAAFSFPTRKFCGFLAGMTVTWIIYTLLTVSLLEWRS